MAGGAVSCAAGVYAFRLVFIVFRTLFFLFSKGVGFERGGNDHSGTATPIFCASVFLVRSGSSVVSFSNFFREERAVAFAVDTDPGPAADRWEFITTWDI